MNVETTEWTTMSKQAERTGEPIDTIWHRVERMKKKGIGEGEEYLSIPEWGITVVKRPESDHNDKNVSVVTK